MSDGAAKPDAGVRVVMVTVPDGDAGCAMARRVVGEGLAACGNVISGMTSVYRWNGEVQEDPETLVLFKTTKEVLPDLMRRVMELHSYEVPELLALDVTDGHPSYLRWVVGEVKGSGMSK